MFAILLFCLSANGFDLEQQILAIQSAMSDSDLVAASQLIDSSLKGHPDAGGLFNLRGVLHAQRNELREARADFEKAVKLSASLTPAWQNLARACQIEADARCAINAWQHVTRTDSANVEARGALANLYLRQGKFADSLTEAASLHTPDMELIRCADLAGVGKEVEARATAAKVAARADFAEQYWIDGRDVFTSAKLSPLVTTLIEGLDARGAASLESLRNLAVAYEQSQDPQQARRTLERVAQLDPRNTAHLLELARLAEASGDYEGALGYLAHARDLAPNEAQIHFLFAKVASEMNLAVEARASLSKALTLEPRNPTYNYAMGFILLGTRDAASASSYFQKFVDARPEEVKGHYALGIACFASGDYAKSKQEMQRVKGNPKTAGGAEYFLGRIARRENDLPASEQHLKRSIELLPAFSESRTELARVYLLQEQLTGARRELDEALRLDPESFEANEQMLVLYRRTRDAAAGKQAELLKKLDADRSKRAELMVRTVEFRP